MFAGKIPPLTYKEVITGLKKLGFKQQKNKATGHEQWVAENPKDDTFKKVTVSKHSAPFRKELVKSMAKQAGVSLREFFQLCKEKKYFPK